MNLSKSSLALAVIAVALAAFFVGRTMAPDAPATSPAGAHADHASEAAAPAVVPEIWTCSMHPQIRMPEPGKCPICGMNLILADTSGGGDEGPSELRMSVGAMQRAKIETAKVELRSLSRSVPLVGKVALDETRVATITSWVDGRLDRLYVDYTGTAIRKGDHVAEIYSPTLFSTQQELLQAIVAAKKVESSSLDLLRESTNRTVASARERLRLFGLDAKQIDALIERGVPDEHMVLSAPIGGVVIHKAALEGMFVKEGTEIVKIADLDKLWVLLEAYESDLTWLSYGQLVRFTVEAYPGRLFEGRIAFIDPVLDPKTRTVKVRINVDNHDGLLKPDMFVSANAEAALSSSGKVVDPALDGLWMCPMHPEVTGDGPGPCRECGMDLVPVEELGFTTRRETATSLAIPETAPLFTGRRSVVYVRLPNLEMPTFEGREVLLGPRAAGYYVVVEGLMEGEEVVTNGSFKIDSELQIRAKRSMMSPGVGGPASQPAATVRFVVPDAFRAELTHVLEAYLAAADELAGDDLSEATRQRLVTALAAVDMEGLSSEAHRAWMKATSSLHEGAEKAAAAEDLDSAREALGQLSAALLPALESFGFDPLEAPLAVFHCPMAFDMKGADWIAPAGPTRNPYFGSDMLGCGDITKELEATGAAMPPGMDMGAEPSTGEASSGSVDLDPVFEEELGALLDAYLGFELGLTRDADGEATRAQLRAAFDAIDMTLLEGPAHMAWMKATSGLEAAVDAAASAGDIEAARVALKPLSRALVAALEGLGTTAAFEGRPELAVFHCPMAFDFEGADWLAPVGPVANPFFGSEMPSCGKLVRELGAKEER